MDSRKIVLGLGSAALIGLVAWAFAQTGSPATARKLAEDREALTQLECMVCYAREAECKKDWLPQSKAELLTYVDDKKTRHCYQGEYSCNNYEYRKQYDNTSAAELFTPYSYSIKNGKTLELCNPFHFSHEEQKYQRKQYSVPAEMKKYEAGQQCFTFKPKKCEKKKR